MTNTMANTTDIMLSHLKRKKEYIVFTLDSGSSMKEVYERKFDLKWYQKVLRAYLHPFSPIKSFLMAWSTGSGKTVASLIVAEDYHEQLVKARSVISNAKIGIYIITSGHLAENQFIDTLINPSVTNYKYVDQDTYEQFIRSKHRFTTLATDDAADEFKRITKRIKREYLTPKNHCYYRFMTYSKIRTIVSRSADKADSDNIGVIDPEYDYSGSLFIFDEAHEIEGNKAYEFIQMVKRNSDNTRFLLLSATPINTNPNEIISVLNVLRPMDKQLKESDYFDGHRVINMDGLAAASAGLVSFVSVDQKLFPRVEYMGKVYPGFRALKLVRCPTSKQHQQLFCDMLKVSDITSLSQLHTFNSSKRDSRNSFDFTYPVSTNSVRFYSPANLSDDISAKTYTLKYIDIDGYKIPSDPSIYSDKGLRLYSGKYYMLRTNVLESLRRPDRGIEFIYHDLKYQGIYLIEQVLIHMGILSYDSIQSSNSNKGVCYYCGKPKSAHIRGKTSHEYAPAKYVILLGNTSYTKRQRYLNVLKSSDNRDGKLIKFVLGTSVVRQSIDFKNLSAIHIMQSQDSLQINKQIIGRGVRLNSHADLPENRRIVRIYQYVSDFPMVKRLYKWRIYNYEEQFYANQEIRSIEIDRILNKLKEVSIDYKLPKSTRKLQLQTVLKLNGLKHLDVSTYKVFGEGFEIEKYTKLILHILRHTSSIKIVDLEHEVFRLIQDHDPHFVTDYDHMLVLYAIHMLVTSHTKFKTCYGTIANIDISNGDTIEVKPQNVPYQSKPALTKIRKRFYKPIADLLRELNEERGKDAVHSIIRKIEVSDFEVSNLDAINELFNPLSTSQKIEFVDYAINHPKSKVTKYLLTEQSKYVITKKDLESGSDFIVRTRKLSNTPIVGHIFNGSLNCYSNDKWVDCDTLMTISVPKFKNAELVGFDQAGEFKIWARQSNTVHDRRKKNKGKACMSYSITDIRTKVLKFLRDVTPKDSHTMLDTSDKPDKAILCSTVRGLFIKKNARLKRHGIRCFYTEFDVAILRKKRIPPFD